MNTLANYFVSIWLPIVLLCVIASSRKTPSKNGSVVNQSLPITVKRLSLLSQDELNQAVNLAVEQVEKLQVHERNLESTGIFPADDSIPYIHYIDTLPAEEALDNAKDSLIAIKTAQNIIYKHCSSTNKEKARACIDQLDLIDLHNTTFGKKCEQMYNVTCKSDEKYRSIDGSCNNLARPAIGKSNSPYRRLLKPDYDGGLYFLRGSQEQELPNARFISNLVVEDSEVQEKTKTQAVPFWGIFIGHDMAFTPSTYMIYLKRPPMCCHNDGRPLSPRHSHTSCAPITIFKNDSFYGPHYQSCMNYVRSLASLRTDCKLGPMEQANQATHFLDASNTYGSTEKYAKSLRAMQGGRLLEHNKRNKTCHTVNTTHICYYEGNARAVFFPHLLVLHTVFVREHNRIANKLSTINKKWNDERLYQESRKIVIAELQHITYNHWLPALLGEKFVKNAGLKTGAKGFSKTYDDHVNPLVSNTFATAGIRTFYSMIDGNIKSYTEDRNVIGNTTRIKDHLNETVTLHSDYVDNLIRSLVTQIAEKLDTKYSNVLTRYWYSISDEFGMDAVSIDIQRGRDHGLPGYTKYRQYCNLSDTNSFEDLHGIMNDTNVKKLQEAYTSVDDIDLLLGLISEKQEKDSLIGSTLRCILVEQLQRTRVSDRYFYDNEGSFTEAQLAQIRKSNLARILCDNSNITKMQVDAFHKVDAQKNSLYACKDSVIKSVNLDPWKE